jgi:hypothetical protein
MKLAEQQISGNWDEPSFQAGMDVITNTMLARKNAMQSVTPRFAGTVYPRNLPGNQQAQQNQQNQQNQTIEPLPAMPSPLDKDKIFLAPNGRKVRLRSEPE